MSKDFTDGIRVFRDPRGHQHLHRDDPVCDFCCVPHSEQPLVWEYPAGYTSIVGSFISASHDAWSACDPCHDLIEANRWETLAARSLTQAERVWGRVKHKKRQEILHTIRENLQRFQAARTGPAQAMNWETHKPENDTWGPLVEERW